MKLSPEAEAWIDSYCSEHVDAYPEHLRAGMRWAYADAAKLMYEWPIIDMPMSPESCRDIITYRFGE